MAMKKEETILLAAMIGFLTIPWFIVGLNIWGWFFVTMATVLLVFEAISCWINDGKTISRMFWEFSKKHKKTSYGILVCLAIAWILLILHLLHWP